MGNFDTEAERLVRHLDLNREEEEIAKAVGEKLSIIAGTDEEQMVEFLQNEEALTIFIDLFFDISLLHPDQAHLFWYVLSQQYLVSQKRFKIGCMQVLKVVGKSGRMSESFRVLEMALDNNDVRMMKVIADVRTNLGKDPVWRVCYDEKADYAQMEMHKIKLLVSHICDGKLNDEMMLMSLEDLMVTMMGHDVLKRCFWKEQGIDKFSKLLREPHEEDKIGRSHNERVTFCLKILDSAIAIVSDNPNLVENGDIKFMCGVVFEVLKSKKECSEISRSSISLFVKVVTATNLGKYLVDLGSRKLAEEVQAQHDTHPEVVQLCGMFLMMTSTSQLSKDDAYSSFTDAPSGCGSKNRPPNRSGRSRKTNLDKRSERRLSMRERTVRPPQNRNAQCCPHGDADGPVKTKYPFRKPLEY